MKKNTLKILVVIAAVCFIIAGANILEKRKQSIYNEPVAIPVTHTVHIMMPHEKSISSTVTFLAKLEAKKKADIASKFTGRITGLLVHEGQKVKRGDLLLTIDEMEIKTALAALQAQLTSAKEQYDFSNSEYKRDMVLFKVGGVAKEKLDSSNVSVVSARSKVKELQQGVSNLENQLSYLSIKAPFDGIVGTIFQRQGDLATPARTILTLNSLPQKLTFSFMPDSSEILVGQSVLFDGLQIGSIKTIYNDAKNGLTVAEAGLDKQIFRPSGSYITIKVRRKAITGCAVPARSLLHRQDTDAIMVYRDNRFSEEKVTVVASDQQFSLIEPCPEQPVALAAEAKLALLPTYGSIIVMSGKKHE